MRAAIARLRGQGGRYRIPLAKTIAISGSINVRDHGPIRRFMALALEADHFRTRQTEAQHDGRACVSRMGVSCRTGWYA